MVASSAARCSLSAVIRSRLDHDHIDDGFLILQTVDTCLVKNARRVIDKLPILERFDDPVPEFEIPHVQAKAAIVKP